MQNWQYSLFLVSVVEKCLHSMQNLTRQLVLKVYAMQICGINCVVVDRGSISHNNTDFGISLPDETMVELLYLEDLLLTISICVCAPNSFEITKNLFYYEIYLTIADSFCLISIPAHYFRVQSAVNTSGCN